VNREFGRIRSANDTFGIGTEQEFAAWVAGHVSDPPDAYPRIKAINAGLLEVSPAEADVLEAGKNECAVG
jgi:hypothetical protein